MKTLFQNKLGLILILLLLASLSTNFALKKMYSSQRAERIRIESNQETLLSKYKEYKGRDSLNTIKVQTLVLTKKELKNYQSELVAEIEAKDIKIKRLKSATKIETNTQIEIVTESIDSIIYVNTTDTSYIDTFQCLKYKDAFVEVESCKKDSTWQTFINMNAEFDIVAFEIPRKLWFIPLGIKEIELIVSTDNPYTHFKNVQRIEIKKRRKKR